MTCIRFVRRIAAQTAVPVITTGITTAAVVGALIAGFAI
jgi:hypothetical protein